MKIDLGSMPPQGHEEGIDARSLWATSAAAEVLEGDLKHLAGELRIRLRGDTALVTGSVAAGVERDCDRCGARLMLRIEGPVELEYRPEFSEDEPARELSAADMDLGFYEDGSLDLSEAVRDHLAVLLPLQVFCDQPETEPLGEGCSQETNGIPEPVRVDPRFAVLQNLKLE